MKTEDKIYNLVVELSNSEPEHFSDRMRGLFFKLLVAFTEEAKSEQREKKNVAEVKIGGWLSAALSDPDVCAEMKADIVEWFTFIDLEDINTTGENNDT